MDPLVLILLFILFLLLVGLAVKSFRGNLKGDAILFLGLSKSGKTYMVCKLGKAESDPKTVSSTVSNLVKYETNENKKLQLVDIPGNDRLRKNELEKYKGGARGIVFVVNSQTISNEIRDVAELIFFYSDRLYDSFEKTENINCSKSTGWFLGKGRERNCPADRKRTSLIKKNPSGTIEGHGRK